MEEAICKRLSDLRDQIKNKAKLSEDDIHVITTCYLTPLLDGQNDS